MKNKKIVFLDRDGVINRYPGDFKYVDSLENFVFLDGVKEAIVKLNKAGYTIFVVSNQAGVSKGIYSLKALNDITAYMLKEIEKSGGKIEEVLYCVHTDEQNCECRKPKVGLIKKALKTEHLDKLKQCYFIGDSIRDVETGENAGCRTILVLSGREKITNRPNWQKQPDFISGSLLEAVDIILSSP